MHTLPPNVSGQPKSSARQGYGWLCLAYVVVMLYSSTVIGPNGLNFVYSDPVAAFHRFLATRFVEHGSDQRADWIGNLLMLVPFGFLAAGAIWPRRPAFRLPAVIAAMLICSSVILAIKYLQLFFPPRTVTLNYIVAQGLGATLGCAGFATWQWHAGKSAERRDPVAPLVLALRIYCAALLIFVLMPLDFALNAADLQFQAGRLPDTILALPGEGRPLAIRAMLIATAAMAFIPAGMLLVFVKAGRYRIARGLPAVTAAGLAITTAIFALSTLVMGATPVLASILYRTCGMVIGAALLRWLIRLDAARLRDVLRGLVPWMTVPYLLAVLLVNRLLSVHWLAPNEAIAQAYPLGIWPLFDYYIVSKAAAAKNIVAHALLYMPIGVGVWLWAGSQRWGLAFLLAGLLSFGVELGRYLRPGLEGDINAVAVAGLAAALATRLMPVVWSTIERLAGDSTSRPPAFVAPRPVPPVQERPATQSDDTRQPGPRAALVPRDDVPRPIGEIEEF